MGAQPSSVKNYITYCCLVHNSEVVLVINYTVHVSTRDVFLLLSLYFSPALPLFLSLFISLLLSFTPSLLFFNFLTFFLYSFFFLHSLNIEDHNFLWCFLLRTSILFYSRPSVPVMNLSL